VSYLPLSFLRFLSLSAHRFPNAKIYYVWQSGAVCVHCLVRRNVRKKGSPARKSEGKFGSR